MYYHIWFVTKYRKATLEGEVENKIKKYFLEIAQNKHFHILETGTNKDHVHMLLEAKDKTSLTSMVRILKSVSAKKVLEVTPHLRTGNFKHFWARAFGRKIVSTSQLESVKNYIINQKRIPHT